jgi:hypothetical protein
MVSLGAFAAVDNRYCFTCRFVSFGACYHAIGMIMPLKNAFPLAFPDFSVFIEIHLSFSPQKYTDNLIVKFL